MSFAYPDTRTVAVDMTDDDADQAIFEATADLEVGMLVNCAGGDPNYRAFLSSPVSAAETLVLRNCLMLVRLCHHYAAPMVQRGRGGIVNFTSGAAICGGRNLVTYGGTKAFDMVFTEGLWVERLAAYGVATFLLEGACLMSGDVEMEKREKLEY